VYDVEDKKYLDLAGGIAVNSVGHAHPYLAKRISEQASKYKVSLDLSLTITHINTLQVL